MGYLYGDSTPFPLEDNFLETLVGLTEAVVAILSVEEHMHKTKVRIDQIKSEAEKEKKLLAEMGQAVNATIKTQIDQMSSLMVIREAERLSKTSRNLIEEAQQSLVIRRDNTLNDLEVAIKKQKSSIEPILERFLLHYALPQTVWGLSWRSQGNKVPQIASEALALSPSGIEAIFRIDIPEGAPWSRAVRVSELNAELTVTIPQKSWLSGKLKEQLIALSRFFITAVDISPERRSITLQRHLKDESAGYEIIHELESGLLTLQVLNKFGNPEPPLQLDGVDGEQILGLLETVDRGMRPLIDRRTSLSEVAFNNTPCYEIENLAEFSRVLIDTAASYVREIVLRSPNTDELSLKREPGDRRREELYIPTKEVTDRIRLLPKHMQVYFEPFGLSLHGEADTQVHKDKLALNLVATEKRAALALIS